MLHEYAVDPELVATWCDRRNGRYFRASFGLGTPRIISKYPAHWKKLVRAAWRSTSTGNDSNRLEELFKVLTTATATRTNADWDPGDDWLDNAAREHRRAPFHAILARGASRNPNAVTPEATPPPILDPEELDERTPLWSASLGMPVQRTAADIANAVGSMLRIAVDIVFVDPHFAPHHSRYVRVLASCLPSVLREASRCPACRSGRHVGGAEEGHT